MPARDVMVALAPPEPPAAAALDADDALSLVDQLLAAAPDAVLEPAAAPAPAPAPPRDDDGDQRV